MTVLRIIPAGDLDLAQGTTRIISGAEYATQRVRVSLDFFLGEWFLDTREGMPYFRDVLVMRPNEDTVQSVFRRGIMRTPGIVSVPTLTVDLDVRERIATIEFEAQYEDGTLIPSKLELII